MLHHPVVPALLIVPGAALGQLAVVACGLAWLSHLVWDHGVGYGLRTADGSITSGFLHTHYQRP